MDKIAYFEFNQDHPSFIDFFVDFWCLNDGGTWGEFNREFCERFFPTVPALFFNSLWKYEPQPEIIFDGNKPIGATMQPFLLVEMNSMLVHFFNLPDDEEGGEGEEWEVTYQMIYGSRNHGKVVELAKALESTDNSSTNKVLNETFEVGDKLDTPVEWLSSGDKVFLDKFECDPSAFDTWGELKLSLRFNRYTTHKKLIWMFRTLPFTNLRSGPPTKVSHIDIRIKIESS